MRLSLVFLPFLVFMFSAFVNAQSQQSPPINNEGYIEIDLSNSLEGNKIIDRIHYLNIYSQEVELPIEALQFLASIQDEPEFHDKLTYQRTEILKILYNERISPSDKEFLCEFYLGVDAIGIVPLHPLLQRYLDEGTL